MERVVVFFDEHIPYAINTYFNKDNPKKTTPVDKFLMDFQPTVLGKGGDALDLDGISHWNNGKQRVLEGRRLRQDYDLYNALQNKQDKIIEKSVRQKFFLIGNHERWIDDLIEAMPNATEGFIDVDSGLNLTKRGFKIVPHRGVHRVGKLNFIHGNYKDGYTAAFHAKQIAQLYHRNMVYGHFHSEQSYTEVSPVDTHPIFAQSVGTMSHVNREWKKNEPNAWVNSFFVAYVRPDGNFSAYVVRIVKGTFTFDGVTYR